MECINEYSRVILRLVGLGLKAGVCAGSNIKDSNIIKLSNMDLMTLVQDIPMLAKYV